MYAEERRNLAEMIVEDFYGSAVMNILTWNVVYSLFPRTTFEVREMRAVIQDLDDKEEANMKKYEGRGWKPILFDDVDAGKVACEFMEARRVGDRRTWVLTFGAEDCDDEGKCELESVRFTVGEDSICLLKEWRRS
jgi:hypothetical protein